MDNINFAKPYLDYLDKEMTIMGILSAFCCGVAGLVAKQALPTGTAGTGKLFNLGHPDFCYIASGLSLMIIAAGFFYWQRSLLAWQYGQIALWATDQATSGQDLGILLQESDTWSGWIPYQVGLVLTAGGFCEFAGTFLPLAQYWEMLYVVFVAVVTVGGAGTIAIVRVLRDKAEVMESKPRSRRRLRAVQK